MKKIKQAVFFITVFMMFAIAGNMDNGDISAKAAVILSAVNFAVMAWSGFSSGLLTLPDNGSKFYSKKGVICNE